MARKKEFGSINQPLNSTQRSITWNRGKRTVVKSKVKANKKTGEIYRTSSSSTVNVFGLIVIILFAVVLIRTLAGVGSADVTFQGFLDFLTTVPQIDISSFINYTFESLQAPDWLGFWHGSAYGYSPNYYVRYTEYGSAYAPAIAYALC